LALTAAGLAFVGAGLAYAKTRPKPVGSGIVVIETNLAYEGGEAAGTGMVLTSSGEILTNNHVIRGATTIKIVVPGTSRGWNAKVVGYDVTDDVAVLQASGASNLKTASLGNSAAVKIGQAVKAVGNAGGIGSLTAARGTVTGLAQSITVSDDQGGSESLTRLIETDAALQPGDSGGPLFNASAKVIGMDTAASSGNSDFGELASGDGYAIPINKALAIAKQIETGRATATVHIGRTAFLGLEITAAGYDGSGAAVANVVDGGPAANAGLVPGDVITSFAGHAVSTPSDLTSLVLAQKPGTRVSVVYIDNGGTSWTTSLAIGSGPPQ
jgi:S1-C subfamily serine protease